MTLCPGCNQGRLEPLTGELRRFLGITDPNIRSACTMDCGTVGRYHATPPQSACQSRCIRIPQIPSIEIHLGAPLESARHKEA